MTKSRSNGSPLGMGEILSSHELASNHPPSTLTDPSTDWRCEWPSSADLNFNYFRLLSKANCDGIGRPPCKSIMPRIAVLGAGAAGLTVARELFRSGYNSIDIFEASERIGGRLYTVPVPGQDVGLELGAMRIPFFSEPGSGNCVTDYYCSTFGISTSPFPNPGTANATTGIFMNDGFGYSPSIFKKPHMEIWDKDEKEPPTEELKKVYGKWTRFVKMVQENCCHAYNIGGSVWSSLWGNMVRHYIKYDFSDLVYMDALETYDESNPGYFGGLGMNDSEAIIFYLIGGSGGWGAFYHVSCLYPIRTLLFGYGSNHQLLLGIPSKASYLQAKTIVDSGGETLPPPGWIGVQSLAEGLFYLPAKGGRSLYDATTDRASNVNLYTKTPVTLLRKTGKGRILVESAVGSSEYQAVVVTSPCWALQLMTRIEGFGFDDIPFGVIHAIRSSHWITSCKVFYPLKERYWEVSNIPQVLVTDTFVQSMYGFAIEQSDKPGVVLISYTWEDDATKLLSVESDEKLAQVCLKTMDDLLLNSKNIGTRISPFLDVTNPTVVHWTRMSTYAGCAKMYRARMWNEDMSLLSYNQELSSKSGLYFAGDAHTVESGWVESALRSALDAVIHVVNNTGGSFNGSFNKGKDYPRYDMSWSP